MGDQQTRWGEQTKKRQKYNTGILENKQGGQRRVPFSNGLPEGLGAFSFVPLSEFVGRPSWTKSGP